MAIFRGIGGAGDSTTDATLTAVTEQAINSANSATSAASSASAAASSAADAASSETNAAASASAAATSETNAAASEVAAAASETAAAASETAAASSESAAAASETAAAASASSAASSASAAATSATASATSATAAAASESAAEAAQAATELLFAQFGDQYLGSFATEPTVDNSGNALTEGDIFWDSTNNVLKFYTGSAWVAPESIATTAATNASASATAAAASETAAAASESAAATSETNAAASESAAATSETNAATSETNAASSATAAAASASAASTSETNAAASASAASASETAAASSETNAAASASAALASETAAAASQSAAATSASNASASSSAAATSATAAGASAAAALVSENAAATSETNAGVSETNAATSETNAANSATAAAGSASAANTSASNAAASASAASTSETNAAASESAAASSAAAAAATYDSFDDRYLGAKSSDPSVDNDGNALLTGALYFDTTNNLMKVYEGSIWVAAYASSGGALLNSNNLSDVSSVSTSRTNLGLGTTDSVVFGALETTNGLIVGGDLTVNGTTTTVNATNLAIADNMIYLNDGSTTTNPDLGWAGNYNDGTYAHAGIFRDATDGVFKFYDGYTPEPGAEIDTSHASFGLADVAANSFTGSLSGNASTATALQTSRTISLIGDVSGSASFNGTADATINTAVADDSHNHSISTVTGLQAALDAKAPLASPGLTGTPTAPTALVGTNTTQVATTAFVNAEIANDAPTKTGGGASGTWGISVTGSSASTTGNAATATKLATARTISLTGDVTGSAIFDGSANASITATVADDSHTHSISTISDEHRLFNNMGDTHATRTSFDAQGSASSVNFGWRYVQGSTNSPGVNSASQYYSQFVGLGNEYAYNSYGMQIAYPRDVSNPYIAIRYEEGGVFKAWQKISAGYADTAGSAPASDVYAWAKAATKPSYTYSEVGAPSTTGTNASGTWGINITGSAGSASSANYATSAGSASSVDWSNVASRPGWLSGGSYIETHSNANDWKNSGFYENGGGGSNWPSATWYNSINVRHSNQGNYHGFQIAMSYYDNNLWFRSYQGTGTFQSWAYAISSQNIGSQSVNYANSAGSASSASYASTVGINYNNDSNSTYQMLWGSGNSVYGTGGIYCNPATDYLYSGSFYCGNWFRSSGQTGWYNDSYGGGIYMLDTTWVRVYNSKAFYVANTIASTGQVIAYYSDERLKTKTGKIENALDKVEKLEGFYYVENELAKSLGYNNDKQQVALSAQAVKEVMPEAVSLAAVDMETLEDGTIQSKSGEDYLTVDYARLVPLLVEAIKELKAEINTLKGN